MLHITPSNPLRKRAHNQTITLSHQLRTSLIKLRQSLHNPGKIISSATICHDRNLTNYKDNVFPVILIKRSRA